MLNVGITEKQKKSNMSDESYIPSRDGGRWNLPEKVTLTIYRKNSPLNLLENAAISVVMKFSRAALHC